KEARDALGGGSESSQVILPQRGQSARGHSICVLGPGNANDIDLQQLATDFEKIALVDLDEAAVGRAVSVLDGSALSRVKRSCPVDVIGVLPTLELWRRKGRPKDAEISAAKRMVMSAPRPDVGTFDVVASTCILTQLIDAVYMALPTDDPRS